MTYKIDCDIKNVKTIFQISDIHIRHFRRHDEYVQVFQEVYNQLKLNFDESSIIVISGDILHNKQQLVPEQIDVMIEFLESLSDIGPVIIFAGNHDSNINNSERMDSITPIVKTLNKYKSNIFYLKNSGLYEFADNIIFSNMSIFDSTDKYFLAGDIPDTHRKKIALYHGTINGAFTDTNYQLKTDKIVQSMFDGFDIVLIGDIHKHQIVQTKDELNNKPFLVYPSSLIQQNYGESLENHGILIWDVELCEYKFSKIPNKYGYITLNIKNGIIEDLPINIIENPRFRIIASQTSQSELKDCIMRLRKDYTPAEITVNSAGMIPEDINDIYNKIDLSNIRNVDFQNNLIQDYIKRNFNDVSDDTIKKIFEINKYLNSQLPTEDITRNVIWKPEIFKFSNMFSYGDDNIIDFSKMSGLVGLFSANTTGKTSVLESLMFCLFGKCSRAFKAINILNNRMNQFNCELLFDISGDKYVINRVAKKSKDGTVKVVVDFYKILSDGKYKSLNGEQRRDTDSIIKSYIGTFDDFILTAIRSQSNTANFIDKTQSERKDLLSTFADIIIFDKLLELGNIEVKEYQTLLKEYKKTDYDSEISSVESDIESKENNYLKLKQETELLVIDKNNLNNSVLDLTKTLIKIDCDITDIGIVENEKNDLVLIMENNKLMLEEKKLDLVKIKDSLISGKNSVDKFIENDIENKNSLLLKLEKDLEKLNTVIDKFKISVDQKRKQTENLLKLEYDPNCKFCMNNIFVKEAIIIKSELENDKKIALQYLTDRSKLKLEIESLSDIKGQYKLYIDEQKLYNELQLKASIKLAEINKIEGNLKSQELKIETLCNNIDKYYKSQKDIESNKIIESEISKLKLKISTLNSDIITRESILRESYSTVLFLKDKKKQIIDTINKFKEIEIKFECYQHYLSAIHRDAIPYELISNVVPLIEHEANNVLSQMVDFAILLELDGKNINVKMVYDENRIWPLEMASGMENFITSLVLRIALIKITNLPKPNFLAIDEGFGTLDSENSSNLPMLLDYLKTQFDFVFIISHMDQMRDYVDVSLNLTKDSEGFSKIIFE